MLDRDELLKVKEAYYTQGTQILTDEELLVDTGKNPDLLRKK